MMAEMFMINIKETNNIVLRVTEIYIDEIIDSVTYQESMTNNDGFWIRSLDFLARLLQLHSIRITCNSSQ
jgi:hypothetical protein